MSLLDKAFEKCVTLVKTEAPDGFGGVNTSWASGVHFEAALVYQTSVEAKIAEKQGVTGLWNVYVPRNVTLEFHNIFKRLSDGQIFRITSKDDKATPKGAGLDLRLISAEEYEIPDEN